MIYVQFLMLGGQRWRGANAQRGLKAGGLRAGAIGQGAKGQGAKGLIPGHSIYSAKMLKL